jgi:hypothetical protein
LQRFGEKEKVVMMKKAAVIGALTSNTRIFDFDSAGIEKGDEIEDLVV